MSYQYPYLDGINLYVKDRINLADAQRQEKTARAIIHNLEQQPGIVLADEVGMRKRCQALLM